jgi:hypothetical protein
MGMWAASGIEIASVGKSFSAAPQLRHSTAVASFSLLQMGQTFVSVFNGLSPGGLLESRPFWRALSESYMKADEISIIHTDNTSIQDSCASHLRSVFLLQCRSYEGVWRGDMGPSMESDSVSHSVNSLIWK